MRAKTANQKKIYPAHLFTPLGEGEFNVVIFEIYSKFINKTTKPVPSPVGEG